MVSSVQKYGVLIFVGVAGLLLYMFQYESVTSGLGIIPSSTFRRLGRPSRDNRGVSFTPTYPPSSMEDGREFQVQRYKIVDDMLQVQGTFKAQQEIRKIDLMGISNLLNQFKPFLIADPKFERADFKHEHYFKGRPVVKQARCSEIVRGNETEIQRIANLSMTYEKVAIGAAQYIQMAGNCSNFTRTRGYITDHLTVVERDFPIAYSLLMFKDVEQSERLLRAIYRPQNIYCIHVDKKSGDEVYEAMKSIANCFDNIFMSSRRVDVQWGRMSVLEPEIRCMQELWNRSISWKYFINLTGQEFPLRSNYELVRILQAYNGANDVEGTRKRANVDRWAHVSAPPHGIKPTKGSVHIVVNRGFVDYVLHDQRAKDLLNWTSQTHVPDETFFSTLNHNPHIGVPGAYKGLPETLPGDIKPFLARYKNWASSAPCYGKYVRSICVFGTGDVPVLAKANQLFANKFHLSFHPFALDCVEELVFNRTRDNYIGKLSFDSRWYEQLGFVNNKV